MNMNTTLADLLTEREVLLADGATGTTFFAMGLEAGAAPELWNVDAPEKVHALHQGFVTAGSDIILTNSFGGSHYRLKLHDAHNRVEELNTAAAQCARHVADRAGRQVIVAGSIGPTGEIFEPVGSVTHEEGRIAFREQAKGLVKGGADVLWIETLSSTEELKAAVEGASGLGVPIVATLSFDTNGRTMMGIAPEDWGGGILTQLPAPLFAYGANCGAGLNELAATMLAMKQNAAPDTVLVAKGNCGIPRFEDGDIVYDGTPELMAKYAQLVKAMGVQIIGGCCGTTKEHVAAMRQALDGYRPNTTELPDIQMIEDTLGAMKRSGADSDNKRKRSEGRRRRRG